MQVLFVIITLAIMLRGNG